MDNLKPRALLGLCGLILCFSLAVLAAGDEPAPPPTPASSPFDGWRRLEFRATKFLVASARSVIERWPPDETHPTNLVRLKTEMSYLGRTARVQVVYSEAPAGAGLPARWMELDPGKKARETNVGREGRLTLRRFGLPPGAAEPWAGPWTESRTDTAEIKRNPQDAACGSPVDPWMLLARLDCLTAAPRTQFVLLSNDGGHVVIARRGDARRAPVGYTDLDAKTWRSATVDQVFVELLPGPGEPDPSVFGMDSGVTLWIDAHSGAPLEIMGRREGVGTIRFRLSGAGRSARPRPLAPWASEAPSALAAP